jgi:hypothetical protein
MATTTNYGWTTPDDTSLVKDGAAAIRTLGTSVDTTTKNLNPSTTLGDIEYRSSTSNTNTRLGIGSSGQNLSVVAGVPAWAASPTSVLTTTGDTLYASAANTLARLGVGTTGQVLTVAGGLPSWATPAGATAFVGVQVYSVSGSQSIANNTNVVLPFNSEAVDTDGFHSTTTNTSRLTVPAGKAGYYAIYGKCEYANSASNNYASSIIVNGGTSTPYANAVGSSGGTFANAVPMFCVFPLAVGDYVELRARQITGGTIDCKMNNEAETVFGMFLIGA